MVDHDFGYDNQVAIITTGAHAAKIGHVKLGAQEIFVKQCLDNISWQVTASCVTGSDRSYRSSKIYGFEMKVAVYCPGALGADHFLACHQAFVDNSEEELASKHAQSDSKKKIKPAKSASALVTKKSSGHLN